MRIGKSDWFIGSPASIMRERGILMPTPGSKQARVFEKQGIFWTPGVFPLINDLLKQFAPEIEYNLWMKIIHAENLLKEPEKIDFLYQLFDGCIYCKPNQNPNLILNASNDELMEGVSQIRSWVNELEQQVKNSSNKFDVLHFKKREITKKVTSLRELADALEKYWNIRIKEDYEKLGKFVIN